MKHLTIAQAYTLCAIDKGGRKVTYPNSTHSGCIIMGAFLELFLAGNIDLDEKKQVVLLQPPAVAKPHYLFYVWKGLSSTKPKTLKKWMEYYLNDFSVKMIRRIVNAVIHSLLIDGCLIREMKRGIFHERVNYRVHQQAIQDIQYSLRTALLEDGFLTNDEIALAILMREGGLLQKYFTKEEQKEIQARLRGAEDSDIGAKAVVVKAVLDELDSFIMTATNLTLFYS